MKPTREFFSAGKFSRDLNEDLEGGIERAVQQAIQHMAGKVGVGKEVVDEAVHSELTRKTAHTALNKLAVEGVTIKGARVLDLGAGLGKLSVEVALRGGYPIAVEPGEGFSEIVQERLRLAGRGGVVAAVGEHLPFQDGVFDVVVSLQVLEHVTNPYLVLQEAFRVLKPGGFFFLTCENYLSFWEAHYRVAWLPLLPKPLGAAYLRFRGRSPEFLERSVTYTTRPGVRRMLKRCGFISMREREVRFFLNAPSQINTTWKRSVAIVMLRVMSVEMLSRVAIRLQRVTQLFSSGIVEVLRKPEPESKIGIKDE